MDACEGRGRRETKSKSRSSENAGCSALQVERLNLEAPRLQELGSRKSRWEHRLEARACDLDVKPGAPLNRVRKARRRGGTSACSCVMSCEVSGASEASASLQKASAAHVPNVTALQAQHSHAMPFQQCSTGSASAIVGPDPGPQRPPPPL